MTNSFDITPKTKGHTADTLSTITSGNLISLFLLYSIAESHTYAKSYLPC